MNSAKWHLCISATLTLRINCNFPYKMFLLYPGERSV